MSNGMVCKVEFLTEKAKSRLSEWLNKGNKKIAVLGEATFYLTGKIYYIDKNIVLFCWEHSFFFPMTLFLRLMFKIVTFKVRKDIVISSVSKVEMFNYFKGGVNDE